MRSLDVGVIGCGTAGSAAALFLARAGHRVTVYERVPSPSAVGAGITIQPIGLHVLARLGLYDYVVSRGSRLERLLCETRKRRTLIDLSYETIDRSLFGLGLHRGVLFEALFGAAMQTPRVTIKTGHEIVALERAEPRLGPRSRWSWLVDREGERFGPHELVVAADGARSQLRDDTHTSKRIEPYPWGALWFVGRDERESGHVMTRTLFQIADGNRSFLGLLPTGLLPSSQEGDIAPSPRLVSLFWSIRGDQVAEWRTRRIEAWKKEVLALGKEAEPVLDQIHDEGQVLYASYHDVVMHRWHARNVVYLGDAAHATSPQLGQGCNLALWDAMELADALSGAVDLAHGLAAYTRRREAHLAFYQLATRWLTPFFQGDVTELGALRDLVMPVMGKLSFFRRLMTLSMLGVIDGFYGDTLQLELPTGVAGVARD